MSLSAMAESPTLVLASGHAGKIVALAVSPDGRWVASSGFEGLVKVWDVSNQRVVATLQDPALKPDRRIHLNYTSLAFTPDGKLLVATNDGSMRLWDPASAALLRSFQVGPTETEEGTRLALLPQVGRAVVARADTVYLIDYARGATVDTLRQEGMVFSSLTTSSSGRVAVGATSTGGGVLLLDPNFKKQRFLELPERWGAEQLDYSAQGERLAILSGSGDLLLWDGNKLSKTGILGHSGKIRWNGPNLLVSSQVIDESPLRELDGQARLIKTASLDGVFESMHPFPDGKHVMLGFYNGELGYYGLEDQKLTRWNGIVFRPNAIATASNFLALGGRQGEVCVFDLNQGRVSAHLQATVGSAESLAISLSAGQVAASDYYSGRVQVYDMKTLKEIGRFESQTGDASTSLAYSADGSRFAILHSSGRVDLYDTSALRAAGHLEPPSVKMRAFSSLAFHPSGNRVAACNRQGDVVEWLLSSKATIQRRVYQREGTSTHLNQVVYSPDGRWLAVAANSGEVSIFEVDFEDAPTVVEAPGPCMSLDFSPDSRTLALGGTTGELALIDVKTGRERSRHAGHVGTIVDLGFSRNGQAIFSAGLDGTVRIWAGSDGRPLATLLATGGAEWVLATPQGSFDGTPEGQRVLEWRVGDTIFALDQFFNQYFTPGLLTALVGTGQEIAAPEAPQALKAPPRVTILSPGPGDRFEAEAEVKVGVEENGGGLDGPYLFVNGHRLPDNFRSSTGPGKYSFRAPLTKGHNVLRATAFNADRSVESRGARITVESDAAVSRQPALHILAVGVDHYKSGLALGYARDDASAIAKAFNSDLFSDVRVKLLLDEQASGEGLQAAFAQLEQEALPHDTVIVYLAGHGTLVGDVYYFLPYDAAYGSDEELRKTGLSSTELAEHLTRVSATKQLVVLDTCRSGAAAPVLGKFLAARDGLSLIKAQQRLARASGTFLLAASTAEQYAKEVPELGHGVLTYALLKGLGDKAAPQAHLSDDGSVSVNALLQYVAGQVPDLTSRYHGEMQNVVQYSTGQDFPLKLEVKR